jgi:hypothetical protein
MKTIAPAPAELLFADYAPATLEPKNTIGAKWERLLAALVPDIGILAGRDIVAVEQASLDLIRTEDLIPGSLPKGWEIGPGNHLFERIHGKDPYAGVNALADCGLGRPEYVLRPVA